MSDDEGPETTPGYKISKKVDMGTILEMDNEDESLRKYKEALLGKAALSGAVARTSFLTRCAVLIPPLAYLTFLYFLLVSLCLVHGFFFSLCSQPLMTLAVW